MTTDNYDAADMEAATTAFEEYDDEYRPAEGTGSIRAAARHAHFHGFSGGIAYMNRTVAAPLAAELAKATRRPTADVLHPTDPKRIIPDEERYANGGILPEGSRSTRDGTPSEGKPAKVDLAWLLGARHPVTEKTDPSTVPEAYIPTTPEVRERYGIGGIDPAVFEAALPYPKDPLFTADPEKWRAEQIVKGSRVIADRVIAILRGVQLTVEDGERVERVLRSRIRVDPARPTTDPEQPEPLTVEEARAQIAAVAARVRGEWSLIAALSEVPPITFDGAPAVTVTQEQFDAVRDHLVKQLGGAAL